MAHVHSVLGNRSMSNLKHPLFILILALFCSYAGAQDAQQIFDSLFGQRIRSVNATRDTSDDVQLASQLLDAARHSIETPKLLTLLCEEAYTLGSRDASGYETAEEAMTLLAEHVQSFQLVAAERISEMRQKEYVAQRGAERAIAGQKLVDAMVHLADIQQKSDQRTAAITLRRAASVARAIGYDKQDELRQRLQQVIEIQNRAERLKNLKDQFAANHRDAKVAKELAEIYVVEMNDPVAAMAYVDVLNDSAWRQCLPLAAKPNNTLTEAEAEKLGDWLRSLAKPNLPADQQGALLDRALAAYRRYLELHPEQDLARKKMELAADVPCRKALMFGACSVARLGPRR
ncbi:hypothetical protein HED60_05480 [Planctomycetales bacterium ZRK34]|nr:hypothetical protein HED60_05480 [Planctomycetales bacterium ZRK34]